MVAADGRNALFEMGEWEYVEFAYDRRVRPSAESIAAPWDEALIEEVPFRKQEKNLTSTRGQRA